jgi:O-antigen ligase
MELGILLIIILAAVQKIGRKVSKGSNVPNNPNGHNVLNVTTVLLAAFLLLILFQMLPLPSGLLKILSPKTFALRSALSLQPSALPLEHSSSSLQPSSLGLEPSALSFNPSSSSLQPSSLGLEPSALSFEPSSLSFPLSFFPFLTRIEFFKWLTLIGLFIFLLRWKPLEQGDRTIKQLMWVVMIVGVLESLYGMFEFFSGHQHILYLKGPDSVTGTFSNRNYFAGYLLMVIPLSMGFLFSREAVSMNPFGGWRHRLSSLDGKTLLIGFSVMVMILGLLFTASRMGILSLLLSFSLISLLFRNPGKGKRFSKTVVLIFGLALLWAAWIGLDAVISRFFSVSESLEGRWEIWVNTFQIFKDFPLFGSGLGTFIQLFPMVRSFHIQGLVTHAENDFLQLASEVGLLGIGLLFVTFLFFFFRGVSRIRSMSDREPGRYIGIGGLVGILALMFHSIVERNIQVPANAFLYTFLWALVLRAGLTGKDDRSA